MARPYKKGLDYFSLDVDIFEDDKLFDIQNEYGCLGESIFLRLLTWVYSGGYYYEFRSMDTLVARLIKSIGSKWVSNKKTVEKVVRMLADANLFDKGLMQDNVITSRSIQRRYLKACERRQLNIDKKYWLLPDTDVCFPAKVVNVDNNSINVDNNSVIADNKHPKTKLNKTSELNNYNNKQLESELDNNINIVDLQEQWMESLRLNDEYGSMLDIYLKGNHAKQWQVVISALLMCVKDNKDLTVQGKVLTKACLQQFVFDLTVTNLVQIVDMYSRASNILSPQYYILGIAYNLFG